VTSGRRDRRWDIGVLADDVTGGAAVAGELARRGVRALVARWPTAGAGETGADESSAVDEPPALVLDTGSRYLEHGEAARRVTAATDMLGERAGLVMKKVDSALRGGVRDELAAFLERWDGPVVVAPACPAAGWRTAGGRQVKEGQAGVALPGLIAGLAGEEPALLDLDTVQAGPASVAREIRSGRRRITVADAASATDLAAIARGAVAAGVSGFVGGYGFGAALAPLAGACPDAKPAGLSGAGLPGARRVLVVLGSVSETARQQVRRLRAAGADEVVVDLFALLDGDDETRRIRQAIARTRSRVVCVHTAADREAEKVRATRRARGWTERQLAEAYAPAFAAAAASLPDAALFLVGGETAGTVLSALGVCSFRVLAELADGVALGLSDEAAPRLLLTKPGAFGDSSTVADVAARLLGCPAEGSGADY
jgi:D-threonate/D-erythronate kinase